MKTYLIETSRKIIHHVRSRPVFSGVIGVAALALIVIVYLLVKPAKTAASYFEVKAGDFLISVVEGGTVEAVNEVIIRNEVEGTARIIYIVPEGSYVKKGDKLVELDSSAVQDAVNQQQINVEKAQFSLVQAEQQFEIQKSTVDSEVDAAKLKMEFALSDLDKFSKGEARQMRRNAEIEITNVLETLKVAEDRLIWSKKLYTNGFETKSKLDTDQLAVSQGNLKWQQATQAFWMVETFDLPKKKRELEAALEEARENLERVKLQGDRKLEQFKADASTQSSTLDLNKKKLERDMKQLQATKIFAPQDGMVVYASGGGGGGRGFSNESMVEEGAVIRNRQELIKLPDIAEMKLTVKIHESHINQVRLGQQAFVVLDSMPDRRFEGFVNRVAPLPDSSSRWSNPNLKVYATEILITDKLPNVKPGVSARAEVVITNLQNVLTVPIQAVTTRKGQQVVFLSHAPQIPVPVTVGMYNNKFIEVGSGLQAGDRVMLSPPFDTDEKDLGGAIITGDDKLPGGDTNKIAKAMERNRSGNQRLGTNAVRVGSDNRPGRGPRGSDGAENSSSDTETLPGRPLSLSGTNQPGGGSGERRPRGGAGNETGGAPRLNREESMKQFDANGDGELDETERAAMREKFGGGRGGPGSGTNQSGARRPRDGGDAGVPGTAPSREENLKKFDTNGDGKLDDAERAAMLEQSGGRSRPASGGTTRPTTRPE